MEDTIVGIGIKGGGFVALHRNDYCRRRPPVTITEQMDIIEEFPERYGDLVGYFSLPLTNVEFKQEDTKVYWRVVGSSQWKVLFDTTLGNKRGMKFMGEVEKWLDIKQLIIEKEYTPEQGDVWRIISKDKVILYYQAHWVTLFEGIDTSKVAPHKHKAEDIEDLEEVLDSKLSEKIKPFVFTQSVSSRTWEIEHNLEKYPSVSIVDSGGNQVMGDVTYNSDNKLTVNFSSAFSGKAYLN